MANIDETVVVAEEVEVVTPIIIELGKQKKKKLKKLKKGRGKLMREVADVVAEVRETLGDDTVGGQVVPLVLIYKKKRKNKVDFTFPFFG